MGQLSCCDSAPLCIDRIQPPPANEYEIARRQRRHSVASECTCEFYFVFGSLLLAGVCVFARVYDLGRLCCLCAYMREFQEIGESTGTGSSECAM